MLQVILVFFILFFVLVLLRKTISFAMKLVGILLGLVAVVLVGVPIIIGMTLEWLGRRQHQRRKLALISLPCGIAAACWVTYTGYGWMFGPGLAGAKFLVPAMLAILAQTMHQRRLAAEQTGLDVFLSPEKNDWHYRLLFIALSIWLFPIVVQAAFPTVVTLLFSNSAPVWWFDLAYCTLGTLVLVTDAMQEKGQADVLRNAKARIAVTQDALNLSNLAIELQKTYPWLDDKDVEAIVFGTANAFHNSGQIELFELRGAIWLFEKYFHDNALERFEILLASKLRHEREEVRRQLSNFLPIPLADAEDYFDRYLDNIEQCEFEEGSYLVSHARLHELNRCTSCGLTHVAHGNDADNDDWYCSTICEETEQVCLSIKDKPLHEFLAESVTAGFVIMATGEAWSQNHRMVAAGGQGHGVAAERANTLVDRAIGKSARVVGDDNAKNGPDRLVNGQEIQVKYCKTGARSIGEAFDNKGDGNFRYMDPQGKPMPIEVPRDQYPSAVLTMERKIREGKVPGITDPADAKKLVVKGYLTYEQAKNVVCFGTIESLVYDVAEGAVVSLSAGGITFAITATISFLNTGDKKQALRAACLQGGKAFGRALIIYVGTQQLHRLAVVQTAVSYIDVGHLSQPMAKALQKSLGVSNTRQVNKALRGTVVSTLVVVAVSTGPDLLKMVRGRMSGAQFTKNLAVAASSTVGGTVGAIAGGAVGASFAGPVGLWIGKFAGGMIGGAMVGAATNQIAKGMMKEDSEHMLEIVQRQVEYLALQFMLTANEVANLSANLNSVLTRNALESMYASRSRKAFANLLVKPVVVGIVKQRPTLRYDLDDMLDAFESEPADAKAA